MISLQASDIFLYQVWLFTRPKFSRKFIQRLLMFCTQYAFLPGFLRFVQNVWKANAAIFFPDVLCVHEFSLNFPLHEFFFVPRPPPTPTLPITFLMVPETFYTRFPVSVISLWWAVCPHLFSALSKFKCLAAKHSCLNQIWTYFLVTFPRLDPNDGITARGCAWMSPEETVVVSIVYILM